MKNKLTIFMVMLVVLLAACSDEFTQSTDIGALSETALQNETGIDLLLTGAYSVLDGINNRGGADWHTTGDNWWLDVISDDAHKGSTDGDQADLYSLETLDWATGNPYVKGKWQAIFSGINRCNATLNLISKVEGDFIAKEAEAHFLRAHYNFELQKMWGNVPFISLENYQATEFNQPNAGAIWTQIEADYQFAIDNLPEEQPGEPGRPTKWTAKAFLAKTMLYQSKWPEALTMFKDVIDNGPYALLPEYVDNFRAAGDNSTESVFAIQFVADGGQSYNGNRGGTLNFGGPNGWCCGFYQPSQDLVNAFQTANGLPLLDTYNQTDVASDYGIASDAAFTPHTGTLDPRLDYTVGRRGIEYNGWGVHPGQSWVRAQPADISGPYTPKKNIYYNGEDGNMGTGNWGQQRSGINYHIMRFSDALLMAAEAAIETGDNATALSYVNMVRNRAKNMTYVTGSTNYQIEPYTSLGDQTNARKVVRMERRLELGMEGQRLFDIRRWGDGAAIMNAYFTNEARTITSFAGKPKPYDAKYNMLPIPISAIDLSQDVLKQNPGF